MKYSECHIFEIFIILVTNYYIIDKEVSKIQGIKTKFQQTECLIPYFFVLFIKNKLGKQLV